MATESNITVDTSKKQSPIRNAAQGATLKEQLPPAKSSKTYPQQASPETAGSNASLFFVGTATTILEWEGLRLMTDPNFLHAGDHVHLGPGVRGTRRTNPAVDLHDLPHIDLVLLSHYHADHFDQEVEASLRRDLPIITTPHAQKHLAHKGHGEASQQCMLSMRGRVCMPGKHVGDGLVAKANDILGAIPPTNGWMLELGYTGDSSTATPGPDFECGYRIYISGDTLYVSELEKIPELYTHAGKPIDLMLIHLGGTTVPGPHMPLLMVTMDAEQGIKLVKLVQPEVTVPIHYDDYDVFLSPLSDFKDAIAKAGLEDKVVYLDRGDEFKFRVK
ncbi:Beta-lactamase superfamily domain-containing protein [Cladophialophora immunda]|nr:Beta-lactamase superfamily domain-containing protein [Cladophialophora immunda]